MQEPGANESPIAPRPKSRRMATIHYVRQGQEFASPKKAIRRQLEQAAGKKLSGRQLKKRRKELGLSSTNPRNEVYVRTSPDRARLEARVQDLRNKLEPHFAPDTAVPGGAIPDIPSAGHCAAVSALLVQGALGLGEVQCVSTTIAEQSHWFNRVKLGKWTYDVDITGDQFGRPSVQIDAEGKLYTNARVRDKGELNAETLERAKLLASRAGIQLP